jgi:mannan endo-1,4-beta-mannosidase
VRLVVALGAVSVAVAIATTFAVRGDPVTPGSQGQFTLPTAPGSYIGLYPDGVPASYTGVTAFTAATGIRPDVVPYYSGWLEPFQVGFAKAAVGHGAVPLVQIDPEDISVAAIAAGKYDSYLIAYAEAVRAYRHPVILSFGHEMNGDWYSWSDQHTSPTVFVAAWRHIVRLFRALDAQNVTWLWTVNVIDSRFGVPSPRPWWPGSSYVTWVGIDGYYLQPSAMFTSLFGPTIVAVRALTRDPILISETAAARSTDQPAKIADLFAGVRLYGLLGFVWFDAVHVKDWRLRSPGAFAAFRREVETYHVPTSLPDR